MTQHDASVDLQLFADQPARLLDGACPRLSKIGNLDALLVRDIGVIDQMKIYPHEE